MLHLLKLVEIAKTEMKRSLLVFITFLLLVSIGLAFSSTLREFVRPFAPAALQSMLPVAATGEAVTAKTGNRGGGPIAVQVVGADVATLPLIERTYGVVKSPSIATISARIVSQIKEIHVKEGQTVKTGDLLISLDDSLVRAQLAKDEAVLLKDQALLQGANLELDRAKGLAIKGAGTKQAYDQAVATQASLAANLGSDRATLDADRVQISFTKITAPIDGRLGAIQAVVGNVVSVGGAAPNNLMTITQLQPLKVSFQLPERVLGMVREALSSPSTLPVRVLQSGSTAELETGNLDFIDSAVDTTSGTINMSATVANSKLALWPGQFVDVEVTTGRLENAVVIPTVAIQQSQTGPFVWVMKADSTVALTPVTVSHSEKDKSAVSSGIAAGDNVVVEGQLKLKDGAAVKLGGPAVVGPAGVEKNRKKKSS